MYQKLLILLMFLTFNTTTAEADVRILTPAAIKELLGSYPARGSAAELSDFGTILKLQFTRTKEQCAKAQTFESVSLENLFASHNGPLSKTEARMMNVRLVKAMGEVGLNVLHAKRIYKRPRPYVSNPLVIPCIKKEGSFAYPSGHATFARVMGLALAQVYPERAEAIMKRSFDISESRVLGGVHHPTDILAGHKLADALFEEALHSPEFLEALHTP